MVEEVPAARTAATGVRRRPARPWAAAGFAGVLMATATAVFPAAAGASAWPSWLSCWPWAALSSGFNS
ncbi:hypothetical protein [Pelolinea submarina]|uniref:hypothetical protein n=1 Tax=Pelolinea submarina TaxID=913107 RepID=UPI001319F035|nr:hypothetical protein [Pelolinea submarina]